MTKPIARLTSRALLATGVLACSIQLALAADPAAVSLYVFDQNTPLAEAEVEIDGRAVGRTSAEGALRLSLEPGARVLRVLREGVQLLQLQLDLAESENAELIATVYPDSAPSVFLESSHRDGGGALQTEAKVDAGPPGELRGRIVSSEDGKPVAGARVFVSGLPVDIVTDAEGNFSATLGAGSYSISVLAASFATQTIEGVEIAAEQVTERPIELTPAGLELPEFVVLEPYIEGSLAAFVEERRSSAAVTDILGAEQISRAGDSDAAGALKRVTGLTLVGGKFVYVRGLGERYSSVLLNGAQIPSPDPTRRVVPLDLFPTDILQGVVVQKTYSAEMPGEFGGGSIGLRTKGFPDAPVFRVSGSLGGATGTTFEDGLGYEGGRRDWTGRDDGSRDIPGPLDQIRRSGGFLRPRTPANPSGFTPQELEAVGEQVAGVYDVDPRRIGPDGSLGIAGGNSWRFGQDWKAGFLASTRYARKFDTRDEVRRFFVASSSGLTQRDEIEQRSTSTEIDVSGFLVGGLQYGEHHSLRGTSLILRQTEDEAREAIGTADNQFLQRYLLEWIENELIAHQVAGEHSLPWFTERARFDWLYTRAQANRYAPNTREYRFNITPEGIRELSQFGETNRSSWADLVDRTESHDLGLNLPFAAGGWLKGSVGLNAGGLDRERDSYIRRYQFALRFPNTPAGRAERDEVLRRLRMEQIINPGTIRPDGFQLIETTQNTDNYFAEQALDYRAATLDASVFDRFRLTLGLREESNRQEVTTFSVINPGVRDVGLIDQTDRLPSASATWWISQNQQVRLGYSKTVSRPDFRELTTAPYVDPILDFITFGNPDLVTAEIRNYDLRWEYYFSPTESFSVAAFRKDFTNPIEKQLLPGSGSILLTLANAEGATNQGIELDGFKQLGFLNRWLDDRRWARALWLDRPDWENWYLSANYSWIDSEIQLDPSRSGFNTNLQRPLEGQSPYVVNLQLGYQSPDGRREASLLYNVSGERIVQVGVDSQPDVYEQPFGQLDFNWRHKLGEQWSLRLRLRNLLDPTVEFRQGSGILREYRKGREIGLSLEWSPF
jgi:TonB-dependent receptor